ncbi:MAG: YitT family protein, partial [Aristaeellaceae bacterium]
MTIRQWLIKPHMPRRLVVLILSVVTMGFCVSVFQQISFGSDPCAVMTQGLSLTTGIQYGTCQLLVNLVALVFILAMRDITCLGIGSVANMMLVGYSKSFFDWVFSCTHPLNGETMLVKIAVFLPVMALFLLAVSFYLVVDLGAAPYDAVPQVLAKKLKKIGFTPLRIGVDMLSTVIGYLIGGTVGVVTVFVCFFMG